MNKNRDSQSKENLYSSSSSHQTNPISINSNSKLIERRGSYNNSNINMTHIQNTQNSL